MTSSTPTAPFLHGLALGAREAGDYTDELPALRGVERIELDPRVTFFVGDNGSGKSTLVEAIAVAAGFNPEGGSRSVTVSTRASHSVLHNYLRLVRSTRRPRTGYFLRAESFFNVATYIEALHDPAITHAYGGALHEKSHGESFISLVTHRFGPNGLYVLDEPEAALSLRGNLALMRRMHDLVAQGSQFIIPTHSPILLGYPDAKIFVLSEDGLVETPYEETDVVELTRAFLGDRREFLHHLFDD